MDYAEEDYLMISGIQHFLFCRRQWALIHIEQQWDENYRTVDGKIMHDHAHDPSFIEKRKDRLIVRAMQIHSPSLGIVGECDVVEFQYAKDGVPIRYAKGLWLPFPIEYKRGKPKLNQADAAQLCAQALCLEEMFCCDIPKGYLYYGETKRREEVLFSEELRDLVKKTVAEMHQLYQRGYTPKVKPSASCKSCSLNEICLPKILKRQKVDTYLENAWESME